MSRTQPTVGVVIPVYRAAPYISDCLRSVLAQTRRVDQVVLVDDRGDDGSMELAVAVLDGDTVPYKVVRQPSNSGPGRARNAGLSVLDTDLVWFVDADDTADSDWVRALEDALVEHDADFAVCRTLRVTPAGVHLGVDEALSEQAVRTGEEYALELLRGRAKCYPCTKLFRRDRLGAAPWLPDQAYEDMAPVFAMALKAQRVAIVNEPLYRYLLRDDSLSTALSPATFDLFRVGDQFADLIAEHQLTDTAAQSDWASTYLSFHYREVLISIAHVAMRAAHAAPEPPALYSRAIGRVRAHTRWQDLPRLVTLCQLRAAVFLVLMRLSPRTYSEVLRWR